MNTTGIIIAFSSIFGVGAVIFFLIRYLYRKGRQDERRDIELKANIDINQHYEKMAENFKKVDRIVDHAKSLLRVRETDKDRSPEFFASVRAKRSKSPKGQS